MTANLVTGGNVGKVNDIANQIRNACMGIMEDTRSVAKLTEARDGLSKSLQNQRLVIAREIAKLSSAGKWTDSDIKNAAKRAIKGAGNDGPKDSSDKTLATFISEVKLFALPKIREQADTIIDLCSEAWDTETTLIEATKAADRSELDTPVHKFTKRLYHLTMTVTRAIKDGEFGKLDTAEAVVNFCRMNDPDHDHERIAKRLENILSLLQDIARDFGNKDVALAAEYLGEVTAEQLMQSRVAMHDNAKSELQASTATTVVTPETKSGGAVVDAASEILNDMVDMAA